MLYKSIETFKNIRLIFVLPNGTTFDEVVIVYNVVNRVEYVYLHTIIVLGRLTTSDVTRLR